jgi:hypothetical protein
MNLCNFIREERRNLTPEVPFFLDTEILCIMRPQQTLKYFVNSLHKYNRPMEKVPILLDLRHLPDEFPKVAWDNFGEVLEGNLLPSLLQIPPLLPKNLKVNP